MILPQGTSLYRYCVGIDIPETWDPTFENPEYANRPQGKKNQIGAYFVVRAKKNVQYKVVKWKRRLPKNVLSDCTIEFTEYKATKDYSKQL